MSVKEFIKEIQKKPKAWVHEVMPNLRLKYMKVQSTQTVDIQIYILLMD